MLKVVPPVLLVLLALAAPAAADVDPMCYRVSVERAGHWALVCPPVR